MNNSNNVYQGVGILDLLLVLFIGLKLGKVIQWSWLWVLSPLWIQVVILALVFIIVVVLNK